jgi:hypothetical protein
VDLPEIERLQAVRLEPGDVVVLTVARPVSMSVAAELKGQLEPVFPGHRVLVLTEAELEILRPATQQVQDVQPPLAPGDASGSAS